MLMGIDIGGTKCAVTVGDSTGKVLFKEKFATAKNVDDAIADIVASAKSAKEKFEITACGISCGGPLNEDTGVILSPPNLPSWDNIPITDILNRELNIPCKVRNDANACAMAEYYFGAGKGCKNMIFLTFGTGMGAGLILDGKLYSGTNGNAGEVGHLRLEPYGPVGFGKHGSFEGFCSGGGIKQLATLIKEEAINRGEDVPWETDAPSVAEYARKGDGNAKRVFDICGEKLGHALSFLIDIINPEKIIIGSVFMRCEDLLRKKAEEVIKREALAPSRSVCTLCVPELGESIGDVAALAVAAEIEERGLQ